MRRIEPHSKDACTMVGLPLFVRALNLVASKSCRVIEVIYSPSNKHSSCWDLEDGFPLDILCHVIWWEGKYQESLLPEKGPVGVLPRHLLLRAGAAAGAAAAAAGASLETRPFVDVPLEPLKFLETQMALFLSC